MLFLDHHYFQNLIFQGSCWFEVGQAPRMASLVFLITIEYFSCQFQRLFQLFQLNTYRKGTSRGLFIKDRMGHHILVMITRLPRNQFLPISKVLYDSSGHIMVFPTSKRLLDCLRSTTFLKCKKVPSRGLFPGKFKRSPCKVISRQAQSLLLNKMRMVQGNTQDEYWRQTPLTQNVIDDIVKKLIFFENLEKTQY